jgi:hypothetical protein
MRHLSHSCIRDPSAILGGDLNGVTAEHDAQPPRSHSEAPVAVCVSADPPAATYKHGASLGCPDCVTEEIHCCPFIWADEQAEPLRNWALRHMQSHLAEVIAEVSQ